MKKRNILLISANRLKTPYAVYPLGLSYIASYLKHNLTDFSIHFIDLNTEDQDTLLQKIRSIHPDYIGISLRNLDDYTSTDKYNYSVDYKKLVEVIRAETNAIIILGGSAFSIYPIVLFNELKPDFGIAGEGEYKIHELITSLENHDDYRHIAGLVFQEKGITKYNKSYSRSTINNNSYGLKYENELLGYYWENGGMMNLQTKRGCPGKCIYCSYPVIEGKKVRTLDMDSIIENLGDLYFNHQIKYVFFTDSVFNLRNDFNTELAQRMIQDKIGIKWGAYFSPKGLDLKFLRLLAKSGLKHIEFGTDSLSNTQLKNYGKSFKVADVIKITDLCTQAGIYHAHFLILGGVGETEETLNETFENSKKINFSVFFPIIGMRIYPGTKLEKISMEEGVIDSGTNLVENHYYLSKNIQVDTIKTRAKNTGQKWVFPDDDNSFVFDQMKSKNKKGLLWHLIR